MEFKSGFITLTEIQHWTKTFSLAVLSPATLMAFWIRTDPIHDNVLSCYIDGGEALSLSAVVARASLLYFRACPSTYFKGKFTVKQSCSGSRVMALMFIMSFCPYHFLLYST